MTPALSFAQQADILIDPPVSNVEFGDTFAVTVRIESGTDEVSGGAAAYLSFDPGILQVVSLSGGGAFEATLDSSFDNVAGEIDFAAGTFTAPFPSGSLELAIVEFEAVGITASSSAITFDFDTAQNRNTDVLQLGAISILGTATGGVVNSTAVTGDEPPVITVTGDNPLTIPDDGAPYMDPGASATDTEDDDAALSALIITDASAVNTAVAGMYTVTYTVTDSGGNTVMATRTVIVEETSSDTPPVFDPYTAPPSTEADQTGGWIPNYTIPTVTDAEDDPEPVATCSPLPDTLFPVGTTTVNCSATDSDDNTANFNFDITVTDTTAPEFDAYDDPTAVDATGVEGAEVTFPLPTATDIADPSPFVSCDADSGDLFPIGDTEVSCTATDSSTNQATLMFTVSVNPPPVGTVLYRVNVGGPEIGAGEITPVWAVDTSGNPSPYHVSSSNGFSNTGTSINLTDGSIAGTAAAHEALFQLERWDNGAPGDGQEMLWSFPLPENTTVEAKLYFAEIFNNLGGTTDPGADRRGERIFSIQVEAAAVAALTNIDQYTIAGGSYKAFMLSHVVTVTDNFLNLEFLHGVENPAIKAIEIVVADPADTAPVVAAVADQSASVGNTTEVPLAVTGATLLEARTAPVDLFANGSASLAGSTISFTPTAADVGDYTVTVRAYGSPVTLQAFNLTVDPVANTAPSVAIDAPSSGFTVVRGEPVSLMGSATDAEDDDTSLSGDITWSSDIDGLIGTGATISTSTLSEGAHTISADVSDSGGLPAATATITVNVDPLPGGTVLYRVNTGGGPLAAADASLPGWSEDSGGSPSPYLLAGGATFSPGTPPTISGAPLGPAPEALFQTERWDAPALPEMLWGFPVSPGSVVEVRLYFSEVFSGIAGAGARVFDVNVEGAAPAVFDDIDVFALSGGINNALVLRYQVTMGDDTLDLEFIHGVENPAIKGIEILEISPAPADDIDPVFDSYSAPGAAEATGPAGAIVNFTNPTATDDSGVVPTVSCLPPSGSQFGLGTTAVTCTATDGSGNTAELMFDIIVEDTSPPIITLDGDDPLVLAVGDTYTDPGATATDLVDGTFAATASGVVDTSTADDYTVTYNATDIAGNVAVPVQRTVTVLADADTTDPVFDDYDPPADVPATGIDGAEVSYALPTATDDSGVEPTVDCVPASGSTFAIGDTDVTCTATDGSGNSAELVFTLTVLPLADGTVLHRINVGGPQTSAADASMPDWGQDNAAAPSPFRVAGTNGISTTGDAIDISDPSLGPAVVGSLFQTERFDLDNASNPAEMLWQFPLPAAPTTVEVRLYFAEIFDNLGPADKRTLRVFDVLVENAGVPALTGIDPFTIAGGMDKGFMLSHNVTIVDGMLDVEFMHVTENPALKAIEVIVAAPAAAPVLDPIADQNVDAGSESQIPYSVSGASQVVGTSAPVDLFAAGLATIDEGTSNIVVNPGVAFVGNSTVTLRAYGSPVSLEQFELTVAPIPDPSILYRVNAGGPELAPATGVGPVWSEDTNANASPFRTAGGENAFSTTDDIANTPLNAAPEALFQLERWDPASGDPMTWEFPVTPGTEVEVRLYLAETFQDAAGDRVFDLFVEGGSVPPAVFDDIDVFVEAGNANFTAVVLSHTLVVTDSGVSLQFAHVPNGDNPAIKGIEIVQVAPPDTTDPVFDAYTDPVLEGNVLGGADTPYTLPTATDNIDPAPSVDCVPAPGSFFALGINTNAVQCTASDASGNTAVLDVTVTVQDTVPPTVMLIGPSLITITEGDTYTEQGATATDIVDGAVAAGTSDTVDTNTPDTYVLNYGAIDSSGNMGSATRTVIVQEAPLDTTPTFDPYTPPPATEADTLGGWVPNYPLPTVTDVEDEPDPVAVCTPEPTAVFPVGTTNVSCAATDSAANTADFNFDITVIDSTPPVISLQGDDPLTVVIGSPFVDPGATATDIVDGDISGSIVPLSDVDTSMLGNYAVTYNVTDNAGNSAAEVTRSVEVVPVGISITPAVTNTSTGEFFDVVVQIEAGGRQLDGVQLFLEFDPAYLQVQTLTEGGDFTIPIQGPTADNVAGTVSYAAGEFDSFPSGTIDYLTIQFQAQAETTSGPTPITINTSSPETIVTFGGSPVPLATNDGEVNISIGLNTQPTVAITAPTDGDEFDEFEVITFAATVTDAEQPTGLESLIDWSSSIDGDLGSDGASIMTDLSPGTHTITAQVTDAGGLSGSDSITVTVAGNTAPTVSITSPADGSSFLSGQTISFAATATDLPDGDLAGNLEWTSSINGVIGSGASIMTVLDNGTHTITASVMDTGGLTGSDSISVTVAPPLAPSAFLQVNAGAGITASSFSNGSFNITNTGQTDLVELSIDLSTTVMPDIVFDPAGSAGDALGKCFTANSGGATVGLVTDGSGSGAGSCSAPFSQPHEGTAADGYDVITIQFNDFNPGESFSFSIDIDPTSIKNDVTTGDAGSVSGFELIGSTATVDFGAAGSYTGSLRDEGSLGGSAAVIAPAPPMQPSIDVLGVATPATVGGMNYTVRVTGPASSPVALLQVDARLFIDPGAVDDGFDIDPFEANEALAKVLYTDTIDPGGTVDIPVTLLATPQGSGPDGGINHFIAWVPGGMVGAEVQTSLTSNVEILEYDPSLPNTAPMLSITSPANGAMFADTDLINFVADVMDIEEPALGDQTVWTSDLDGELGTGASISVNLTGGVHTITAHVIDNGSLETSDSIVVEVSGNAAPVVAITQPNDGQIFDPGSLIGFIGTATDAEDGDLAASLTWTSDLAGGTIGSGGSFSIVLEDGTHEITASVTDTGGITRSQTITVIVAPPLQPAAFIQVNAGAAVDASTFDTGAFAVMNTGEVDITSITLNLGTTFMPDIVFDPLGTAGDATGKCFLADVGAVGTGLVTDGSGSGTGSCAAPFSQPHNGNPDDGYEVLTIEFNDFNPGETFAFSVDIDPTTIKNETTTAGAGSVSGFELIGAGISVAFDTYGTFQSNLRDEGSAGGSAAVVAPGAPAVPAINVLGVATPGTTPFSNQVVQVSGEPGASVQLLQVDARLAVAPGYDVDPFEANQALVKALYSATIGAGGTVDIPVTLTRTAPASGPEGGLNHFIAWVTGGNVNGQTQTSMTSSTEVVEFDPTGGGTTEMLQAVEDSFAHAGAPNWRPGSANRVLVIDSAGTERIGFINFDLLGLSGTVTSAVLKLPVRQFSSSGTLEVRTALGLWTEPDLNYNTMPPLSGVLASQSVSAPGDTVDIDVTAIVQGWLASPSTAYGFALSGAGGLDIQFFSRETGDPAVLEVTTFSGGGNTAPVVSIDGPVDGANFAEGDSILFEGTATDAEDGVLTASLTWTSSLQGAIGTGGNFSVVLDPGTHIITAAVSDSGALSDDDMITVTVTPIVGNTPPVVSIDGPVDGADFAEGDSILFEGTATDAEDGVLTAALTWTSSLQGAIGTGGNFSLALDPGTHIITAAVSDSGALSDDDMITVTVTPIVGNTPPVVSIDGPVDGADFAEGDSILFEGTATDAEDGVLTASLTWTSSLQGAIGTGGNFSVVLDPGTHIITAAVSDSGALSDDDMITVTVTPIVGNTPPVVSIDGPVDGADFAEGDSILFEGTATDAEDGVLTAALTWTSSLQGAIGTGGNFSLALDPGTHIITAAVSDSGALSDDDMITVTVTPAGGGTTESLTAVEDSFAHAGAPNWKPGSANRVLVIDPAGTERVGFIDFDLLGLSGTVTSAVLKLPVRQFSSAGALEIRTALGVWTEPDLSYNTMPPLSGVLAMQSISAPGATVDIDVTAIVQSWLTSPSTAFGFALSGAGGLDIQFFSRETGDPAVLEVTTFSGGGNTTPVVSIDGPVDGADFAEGDSILFEGTATDAEDGVLTASLTWTSSLQGAIGTGGNFSVVLDPGTHIITAAVSDSGALSDDDMITVTVTPIVGNTPPVVSIDGPVDGADFAEGDSILFEGTATDAEDGVLTAALTWTSSLQGAIGTGGNFSLALDPGTHIITAAVSDSGALSDDDMITVTVTPAGGGTTEMLTAVEDSFAHAGAPNWQPGSANRVLVIDAAGTERVGFIDFDLLGLSGTVTSAVLKLPVRQFSSAGALEIRTALGVWTEPDLSYNTMPPLSGVLAMQSISAPGATVDIDVTAIVQSWLTSPSTAFGFALSGAGGLDIQFFSRETGDPAVLEVTTSTP